MNDNAGDSVVAPIVGRITKEFAKGLSKVTIAPFFPSSGLQRRLGAEAAWFQLSSVIATQVREARNTDSVLSALLKHSPATEQEVEFNDHLPDVLAACAGLQPPGWAMAIRSRCRLVNGNLGHIPMMDFACDVQDTHRAFLKAAFHHADLRTKYCPGVLLESGNSYHFYGFRTLNQDEWIEFVGRCLLIAPFSDIRFIAHCLIAGGCQLRVTDAGNQSTPRIIDELPG